MEMPSDKLRTYEERIGEGQGQGSRDTAQCVSWALLSITCRCPTIRKRGTCRVQTGEQGRVWQVYEAPASCLNGDTCDHSWWSPASQGTKSSVTHTCAQISYLQSFFKIEI